MGEMECFGASPSFLAGTETLLPSLQKHPMPPPHPLIRDTPHTDGCCQPIHYSFTATAHSSASYLACETLQCLVAPVTKPERTRAPWPILSPSLLCSSSASPHHGHTLVLPLHPFLFSIVLTLLLKPVQCKCSGKRDLRSSPTALQFLGPAALQPGHKKTESSPHHRQCQACGWASGTIRVSLHQPCEGGSEERVPVFHSDGEPVKSPLPLCSISGTPSSAHSILSWPSPDPHLGLCV